MNSPAYRALVVDDEPAVRRLTVDCLQREGFQCDAAGDGHAALELVEHHPYDLVVTDLRMPNGHGHSLAVQLLARDRRPVVAVLTGVAEPKLAKDLIARGIDELTFKPVDFTLLGAKLRAMVNRRAVDNKSRGSTCAERQAGPGVAHTSAQSRGAGRIWTIER